MSLFNDITEVIEGTEYSADTKIVNLVRLKIDVSSSRIVFKLNHLGTAQDMDISDIRAKFGSKYNSAINQAVSYARSVGLR